MNDKSVSVVMVYYNRPQQLAVTLKSIEYFCGCSKDFEIIIVDDASDEKLSAGNVVKGINLPITIIEIQPDEKHWINSSVPFNRGIFEADGDIICIQPGECTHYGGNIIEYARHNTTDYNYLTFSCYITLESDHVKFGESLNRKGKGMIDAISQIILPLKDKVWINHPLFLSTKYHFFSSMTRDNISKIGGFNEEFANGYAWEDNEFLFRIEESGLDVVIVPPDFGFVIHQWHPKAFNFLPGGPEWEKNKQLYKSIVGDKRIVEG